MSKAAGVDQARDAVRGECIRRRCASPKASATGWPVASPLRRALDGIAPPLQADGAELRLGHLLGDAGELDIEGIESQKIGARLARREQSGKGAIGIA